MKPVKSFPGRRAFWYARISAVMHFFEPIAFGLGLAAGIFLTTRQCGEVVLLDRRGGTTFDTALAGVLLVAGVALVAGSLLFFHRKPRLLRQRLLAGGTALSFFAIGYSIERGSVRTGSFFGFTTLTPSTSFVEDYPARPKVRYQVNGWGLRGGEWSQHKPAGAVRVAIVGDSFVFGSGVEAPDTLAHQLDARLRERFVSARFEVLNLGVPGNNLASHFGMLRVAEEQLGADVLVACLTLPNDFSEWDGQEERLAHGRVGGFSFASFLFGYRAAITLWGERKLARELTDDGLAFLQAEVSRFAAARRTGIAKPLVLFAYSFADPRVTEQLRRIPNVVIVPSVSWQDDYFIPADGHPNALGNKVFSQLIGDAVAPSWLAPE